MINHIIIAMLLFLYMSSDEIQQKGELFGSYLKNSYNISIPDNKHFYFVVQAEGCESCKPIDFSFLKTIIKRDDLSLIISYPNRAKLPESIVSISKEKNVLIDRGKYYKWDITPFSDALIVTNNKKVVKIIELEKWNKAIIINLLDNHE